MDLNRDWLRWRIAIGSGPRSIVLDFPSFLVGCAFTTMMGPILQKLIGRLLVGLISVCKFLVIVGSIVFIIGVVSKKYTYDDFKVSIRKSGKLEEIGAEPNKAAKRTTFVKKDEDVGSYNYFEIPITKEAPTIPYTNYDDTSALKKPRTDAPSVALSNSNRYENFINMAKHK
ncbi:YOR097C [Saccharomyces arboricola H-6]|uniref:YOR097C n=1 Tax=Saccharomyces arboricola (strain H-6 / AS 2.3317 / CBS 10644) TaxID=1160507 RepID=J8PZ56_SACAR|nr:YOR097C [Saccharomyces arboricola H-6]